MNPFSGAASLYKIGMKTSNKVKSVVANTPPVKAIDKAVDKTIDKTIDVMKSNKYGPIVNAKTIDGSRERLENFYTGKKLNSAYVAGAGALYLAGSNAKQSMETQFMPLKLATMNPVQYGAPDVMMYDGVGQTRAPKNMNADGSLVFGLHNMRRG